MNEKPVDWDKQYSVTLQGKHLEAMRVLAKWALEQDRPPLVIIAAADQVHTLQKAVREEQS